MMTGMGKFVTELSQAGVLLATGGLGQWPGSGIPPSPGAWLMSTARHRAIDRLRRDQRLRRNLGQLTRELQARQQVDVFDGPAELAAALDAGAPRAAAPGG
jgi:predicted RNA polymerase sigma factor